MADENEQDGTDEQDETPDLESALGEHFDKHFAAKGSDGDGAADDDEDDDAADEGDDRPPARQSESDGAGDEDESDDSDEDSDSDEEEEEDDEGDGAKASKKGKQDEDDDDEEEEDELDDLDEEFLEAAKRHHIPLSLKNAPPEAKQFILERAKQMNQGFTRLSQEHATFRKERAELTAERAFQREHPVDFILEMLSKEPATLEKLNTQLEKMRDDDEYKAVRLENIKNRRQDAERSATDQLTQEQERRTRGNALAGYAKETSQKYGIPFDLVQPHIVARILASKTRDISEEEIRDVVREAARVYKRHVGAHKGAKSREHNQAKLQDREKTRPSAQRRRKGGAATSGGERAKEPKSLTEALERAAARILPDMPRG